MKGILTFTFILFFSCGYAQNYPMAQSHGDFASSAANMIVDWVTRGIQYLFELFDLKVRSVRFLTSLYTTDNLVLLKKFINVGLRFGDWFYGLIPNSTSEGNNRFLSFLFPQVDQRDEDHEQDGDSTNSSYGEDATILPDSESSSDVDRFSRNTLAEDYKLLETYGHQIMDLNSLINGPSKK